MHSRLIMKERSVGAPTFINRLTVLSFFYASTCSHHEMKRRISSPPEARSPGSQAKRSSARFNCRAPGTARASVRSVARHCRTFRWEVPCSLCPQAAWTRHLKSVPQPVFVGNVGHPGMTVGSPSHDGGPSGIGARALLRLFGQPKICPATGRWTAKVSDEPSLTNAALCMDVCSTTISPQPFWYAWEKLGITGPRTLLRFYGTLNLTLKLNSETLEQN